MRDKADAIDYKYFPEPNIPKYRITKELLDDIKSSIPALAYERREKYVNEYNLSLYDANVLVKSKKISDYFEECINLGSNAKEACNWITTKGLKVSDVDGEIKTVLEDGNATFSGDVIAKSLTAGPNSGMHIVTTGDEI
jgi:aspartyl-tRNA(Asn)/glutamyl-tRNA(Gln) amidotransferase subunit B